MDVERPSNGRRMAVEAKSNRSCNHGMSNRGVVARRVGMQTYNLVVAG